MAGKAHLCAAALLLTDMLHSRQTSRKSPGLGAARSALARACLAARTCAACCWAESPTSAFARSSARRSVSSRCCRAVTSIRWRTITDRLNTCAGSATRC